MQPVNSMHPRVLACLLVVMVVMMAIATPQLAAAGPMRTGLWSHRAGQQTGDGGLPGDQGEHGAARIPPGVRVTADVAYGPAARQRLDVYAPARAHAAPVIVMVHGGAWMFGKKSAGTVVQGKVARWVPRGFVFVSIDYRMLPEVQVSDEAQDVARALAYVQQHAGDWGGDGHRVVLMGHSAGAHLVALLSASPTIARAQGVQPWLGTVALDSAAYDVSAIMQRQHYRFYDRVFGSDQAAWVANSPTAQLSVRGVPLLAVCSSQRDDSCPAAWAFVGKAKSLGGVAQVVTEDKSHMQINDDLGTDPAYTAQVEAFMRRLDPGIAQLLSR